MKFDFTVFLSGLLFTFFVILGLTLLIKKLVLKKFIQNINNRAKEVSSEYENINLEKENIDLVKTDLENKIKYLRNKASQIISIAKIDAEAEKKEILEEANQKAIEIINDSYKKAKQIENNAKKKEMDNALLISKKIIKKILRKPSSKKVVNDLTKMKIDDLRENE